MTSYINIFINYQTSRNSTVTKSVITYFHGLVFFLLSSLESLIFVPFQILSFVIQSWKEKIYTCTVIQNTCVTNTDTEIFSSVILFITTHLIKIIFNLVLRSCENIVMTKCQKSISETFF